LFADGAHPFDDFFVELLSGCIGPDGDKMPLTPWRIHS